MNKSLLLAACLLFCSSLVPAASVHQCVVGGQTVFQDTPCSGASVDTVKEIKSATGAAPPRHSTPYGRWPDPLSAQAMARPPDRMQPPAAHADAAQIGLSQGAQLIAEGQARRDAVLNAIKQKLDAVSPARPVAQAPGQPPVEWGFRAEVALVSTYDVLDPACEGNPDCDSSGLADAVPRRADVEVDRPGKNVLLVLTSAHALAWHVRATPGTHITGVLYGHQNQTGSSSVTAALPTQQVSWPYVRHAGTESYAILRALYQWFGLRQIDMYALPLQISGPVRVGSGTQRAQVQPDWTLDGWPVQPPMHELAFQLRTSDGASRDWTARGARVPGPMRYLTGHTAVAPAVGDYEYEATAERGSCLTAIDKRTHARTPLALPADFPECEGGEALALDTQRHVLLLLGRGRNPTLYRFDMLRQQWLGFEQTPNLRLSALAYDAVHDRFVGWDITGPLYVLSWRGQVQASYNLVGRLPMFNRVFDRDAGWSPTLNLVAQGDDVLLIAWTPAHDVLYVWDYNLTQPRGRLTYKAQRGAA